MPVAERQQETDPRGAAVFQAAGSDNWPDTVRCAGPVWVADVGQVSL